MKHILTVGLVLIASSCVSLTDGGKNVRIGKTVPDKNCQEINTVYGEASMGSPAQKLESAQNELRNKTANLGGNFVVMDIASGGYYGASIAGRAFKCP